tara:strand:+ start:4076 stop:5011 length:936 start_codon:yes stop_codon:yes gene_type:complete
MNSSVIKNTKWIKEQALGLGFLSCGISKAGFLEDEAPRLENWLNNQNHGEMRYMENHFDKRLDPTILVPGAKSVVSLTLNYYTSKKQIDPRAPKISQYAYGKDYHIVIKEKLKQLLTLINQHIGTVEGRVFVDSAPVMDKAWAAKSGLGWIGKNSNLISKQVGSFFFIAELILDLELEPDYSATDHCGSCTKCIDACPTEAIKEPYQVDGSKCISYFTIELKDSLPKEFKGKMDQWMFGCDICQDVCPWNKFSSPHKNPLFDPHPKLLKMTSNDWRELTLETFKEVFKDSSVERTKFEGLSRNISFLKEIN